MRHDPDFSFEIDNTCSWVHILRMPTMVSDDGVMDIDETKPATLAMAPEPSKEPYKSYRFVALKFDIAQQCTSSRRITTNTNHLAQEEISQTAPAFRVEHGRRLRAV